MHSRATIVHVFGARPNFVKMAPVVHALRAEPGVKVRICNTGQHYDRALAGSFIEHLGMPRPDHDLGVGSGNSQQGGAQIGNIVAGGPADKGGLKEGDRVVQIGGQPVRDADDLSATINDHKPGDKVAIVVERGGQRRTLTVTLGSQPSTSPLN